MASTSKASESVTNNGERLAVVRDLLSKAVAELHSIAHDPNSARETAFAAIDMYKSLRRFASKI